MDYLLMNIQIELEALISEREGMKAHNKITEMDGNQYGHYKEREFIYNAEKIRALKDKMQSIIEINERRQLKHN